LARILVVDDEESIIAKSGRNIVSVGHAVKTIYELLKKN
jgi:hypothetical protein